MVQVPLSPEARFPLDVPLPCEALLPSNLPLIGAIVSGREYIAESYIAYWLFLNGKSALGGVTGFSTLESRLPREERIKRARNEKRQATKIAFPKKSQLA